MRNGGMMASGTSDEIAVNEDVRKHYLGEGFVF
jgi:lipopolysaccharide export system ATP-binding protein